MSWFEVTVLFILGVLSIAGALGMVIQTNPIRSALGLLVTMLTLGLIYLLISAPFVGFVQLVVYAGAIVVLFLLAMMNFPVAAIGPDRLRGQSWIAYLVLLLLGIGLQQSLVRFPMALRVAPVDGTPTGIGALLMGPYLYIFELASVLLLIALVAAIYLTREVEPPEEFERDPEEVTGS